MFQSLFFWMLVIGAWDRARPVRGWSFQSLFFWMLVWVLGSARNSSGWTVSILVLLDDGHRAHRTTCTTGRIEEFQSLFFWMMVIGARPLHASLTPRVVSILVLLDDGHRAGRKPMLDSERLVFQSLFFWMMVIGAKP